MLVVSDSANAFGSYYAEILRAEGLNEFAVRDVDSLTPALLSAYQVVVLSDTAVTSAQVSALTSWVNDGGNLIAMRPRQALAPLLGLGGDGGNLDNGYVSIAQSGPGAGITAAPMQFHGQADVRAVAAGTQQVGLAVVRRGRGDAAQRRRARRPGGRLHIRPRAIGRLHPAGQPGPGRRQQSRTPTRATRSCAPTT